MASQIIYDEDFAAWLEDADSGLRVAILAHVELLKERGPHLGRPYVDSVKDSEYSNMKELRVQYRGDPWRVLFAFDPRREAVLLLGGNKAGDKRWYKANVPIADERFRRHLASSEE
ncbi:MAG TPA: type II toxin-antitoxin system RelE/ParE family toxin [Isosphaeraceae bacterium]